MTTLDQDIPTLHIRCGNDIQHKLTEAGFQGDFLCFADPYIQGPVPSADHTDSFIRTRADFIADNRWCEAEQAHSELSRDYQALEHARNYQRIAFWFEHDAYNMLAFSKLLHFFSEETRRAPVMQYLCADHYPSVERFIGLGQLEAEAMPVLWQQFQPLEAAHFQFGRQCWEAYTSDSPQAFAQLIYQEPCPFPATLPGLQRHIRELPWYNDGLALSERITLQILAELGSLDAAELFYHWYTKVYEPLPFMGDSSYWRVLAALNEAREPAITIRKTSVKIVDWQISITPLGRDLLAGHAHWLTHNNHERWWGGTHNRSSAGVWYWDETRLTVRQTAAS